MKPAAGLSVLTIGHSTHPVDRFIELLQSCDVNALADVRSNPFSRFNPQYNRAALSQALHEAGIAYVFVGKELGARSEDASCYENGQVQFSRLSKTALFVAGIDRIIAGAAKFKIALMCAEKEPLDCHRTLLVSRALEARGISMAHILSDGSVEPQATTMSRLLDLVGLPQNDMFKSRPELVAAACQIRERKVAYTDGA
ncbi:MAG: DUF488 domain-containing protein [Dyella sp.]